jgi:hypothetical protein
MVAALREKYKEMVHYVNTRDTPFSIESVTMDSVKMAKWREFSHCEHLNMRCRRSGPHVLAWAAWQDGTVGTVCLETIIQEIYQMAGLALSNLYFFQVPRITTCVRLVVEGRGDDMAIDFSSMELEPPMSRSQQVRIIMFRIYNAYCTL